MAQALSRDQEGGCEMPAERKASRKQKGNVSRKEMPAESPLQRDSEPYPAPTPRSDQEDVVMTMVQKIKPVEESVMGRILSPQNVFKS